MQHRVAPILVGWLLGLVTFWLVLALSGGWYTYELYPKPACDTALQRGWDMPPGMEVAPGQPNPCYFRYQRFHLP
jgi:hypothetical protein